MIQGKSFSHPRFPLWILLPPALVVGGILAVLWQQAATPDLPVSLLPAAGGRTVTSMAFCGSESRLILGWDDGSVSRWDPPATACVPFPAHPAAIKAVAATHDGRLAATADDDGGVRLWEPGEGRLRSERRFPGACRLRFSGDGTRLACGTDDGRVEIWDLAQGTVAAGPAGHKGPICGLEFTSDGRTLIAASWGLAQVWDVPRRRPLVRLEDWRFNPEAMAIGSGGRQLLVVDDHETLTRWDLSTGRRLETIPGRRRVAQAVFSPSAGTLTVASRQSGQIRIRDVVPATDVVTLRHLGPPATALALAPNGRWLAAAAADGSVWTWSLGAGIDASPWRADIRQRAERRSVPLAICFVVGLAGCCLASVADWRRGLWLCFALGLLRDPVRKLLVGHPVWVTLSLAIVWLAVGLGFLWRDRHAAIQCWRSSWRVRLALVLTGLALLPAAGISLLSYPSGWQFVLLGGGSFGFAWLGVLLGWSFPRSASDVTRLLAVFCVVHAGGVLGCLPEALRCDWAVLGGIDADWYRSFATGWTRLVSGLYRSPDVLGWHAAQLVMFGAMLLAWSAAAAKGAHGGRDWTRALWLGTMLLAVVALLLAGRRKMAVMPLVFFATWLVGGLRGRRRPVALAAFVAAILVAWLPLRALQRSPQAPEIVKYLAWTADDTLERAFAGVRGAWGTKRTAGMLGHGLGTATQGRYYFPAVGPRLWQEDGLGRTLAESGVLGTVLLLGALVCLGLATRTAMACDSAHRSLRLPLVGVVLANLACYAVSHQLYSGDPTVAATVGLCLGLALSPRISDSSDGRTRDDPPQPTSPLQG